MSAATDPTGLDLADFGGADPILAIAEEVFTAMVDGEPGHLWATGEDELPGADLHAWVDVRGDAAGRVLISTERAAADELTRALLGMAPEEDVTESDLVDAFGEMANVVGGNVKALVPDPGVLTLPEVATVRPATDPSAMLHRLALRWRGHPLTISLWRLA